MATTSCLGFNCSVPSLYYASQAWAKIRILRLCRIRVQAEQANSRHLLNLPQEILSMVEMEIVEHVRRESEAMPLPWTQRCCDVDGDMVSGLDFVVDAFIIWLKDVYNIDNIDTDENHPYTRLDCLEHVDECQDGLQWEKLKERASPILFQSCLPCRAMYIDHWERVLAAYHGNRSDPVSEVSSKAIRDTFNHALGGHGLDTVLLMPLGGKTGAPELMCKVSSVGRSLSDPSEKEAKSKVYTAFQQRTSFLLRLIDHMDRAGANVTLEWYANESSAEI